MKYWHWLNQVGVYIKPSLQGESAVAASNYELVRIFDHDWPLPPLTDQVERMLKGWQPLGVDGPLFIGRPVKISQLLALLPGAGLRIRSRPVALRFATTAPFEPEKYVCTAIDAVRLRRLLQPVATEYAFVTVGSGHERPLDCLSMMDSRGRRHRWPDNTYPGTLYIRGGHWEAFLMGWAYANDCKPPVAVIDVPEAVPAARKRGHRGQVKDAGKLQEARPSAGQAGKG